MREEHKNDTTITFAICNKKHTYTNNMQNDNIVRKQETNSVANNLANTKTAKKRTRICRVYAYNSKMPCKQ